jgi:hypothetical protein
MIRIEYKKGWESFDPDCIHIGCSNRFFWFKLIIFMPRLWCGITHKNK